MTNLIPLRVYLQLEGFVALVAATGVYHSLHFSWWLYGILFFTPDVFMLGYLVNLRMGAKPPVCWCLSRGRFLLYLIWLRLVLHNHHRR